MERSVRYFPNSKRHKGGFEADSHRLWHREMGRKERDRIRNIEEFSRMFSISMRSHTGQEPNAPKYRDVMAEYLAGYFLKELPHNYNQVNPEAREAALQSFLEGHEEFGSFLKGKPTRNKGQVYDALWSGFRKMDEGKLRELYKSEILPQKGSYQQD